MKYRKRRLLARATGLIAGVCFAASANATLLGHFVHNYGSVIITMDVFDGQPGGRYLWTYTVDNLTFDPAPGTSNGFSGFELFLPTPIPEIADITPNPGSVPPWEIDCCSGNPVEWDIPNSDGNGVMPGNSMVFSFTTAPRLIATNDEGWFHTWEFNGQTAITPTPGMHVPLVEGLIPIPCGNGVLDPGEQCDPPGSACGAFLNCSLDCQCTCGNGVLDPGEECDPPGSACGSPAGAFLCASNCTCSEPVTTTSSTTVTTTTAPTTTVSASTTSTVVSITTTTTIGCVPTGPENTTAACSDHIDNDCNGLVDCADPSCNGIFPCPRAPNDPALIRFGRAGSPDLLRGHARIPMAPIDLTTTPVGVLLSNGNGLIYWNALPAGALSGDSNGRIFRFQNPNARTSGGLYGVKIKQNRDGVSYTFGFSAYGDLSAATDPNMRLQFYMGTDPNAARDGRIFITRAAPWTQTAHGWRAPKDH